MSSLTPSDLLLQHIQGEFAESPGLRLTPWQFQRLWNLEAGEARQIIDLLVQMRFLREARDGAFVRRDASSAPSSNSISARWPNSPRPPIA
jgi:hypothetical protein